MVIKTIPKKKKCNKAKWLFEDSLQIAEKGREVKDREEERYIPETETVTYFIFWGSRITADGDCSHEIKKNTCFLEEKL